MYVPEKKVNFVFLYSELGGYMYEVNGNYSYLLN